MTARHYPPQKEQLRLTRSVEQYVQNELFTPHSPFRKIHPLSHAGKKALSFLCGILAKAIGRPLLVESTEHELAMFDSSVRKLLSKLLKDKTISRWECGVNNTEHATHYVCSVISGDIRNYDDNKLVCHQGALSNYGAAENVSDALKIALAEAIERISSCQWSDKSLLKASLNETKSLSGKFIKHSYIYEDRELNSNEQIGWARITDLFTDNADAYIPASTVYMFYPFHHPNEPKFLEVSSNAVAAQTSVEGALTKALYEAFERDGVLMYWLNKITPTSLDTNTLPKKAKDIIKALEIKNCRVHLLDCKTEYGIPIIVSVLIDNINGGVYMNAVSGLNFDNLIEKIVTDTQRWAPHYRPQKPDMRPESISNMAERERFWFGGYMKDQINWFVGGKKISFEDYKKQFSIPRTSSELGHIKDCLSKQHSLAYYYHYRSPLADDSGLCVVRAIVPDLIPIYFNENKKHLNVPRLYTFARKMGYKDRDITVEELNTIPHPFI